MITLLFLTRLKFNSIPCVKWINMDRQVHQDMFPLKQAVAEDVRNGMRMCCVWHVDIIEAQLSLEEVGCEQRSWLLNVQQVRWEWWMEWDRKTKVGRHFRKYALCTGQGDHPGKEGTVSGMINHIPTNTSFPKHQRQAKLISGALAVAVCVCACATWGQLPALPSTTSPLCLCEWKQEMTE